MDKIQILKELDENVKNMEKINDELSMLNFAIYQKGTEKLKEEKIQNIKNFFNNEAKKYSLNSDKFKDEIQLNVNKYEEQINKLITAYDDMYLNVFKIMQGAINNQKIAIANIVTEIDKRDNNEDIDKAENINNIIIACVQKKLNYAVIIDECYARLNWCVDELQKDLNEIFINNTVQLQAYNENVVVKLRNIIVNKIFGKGKYKKFLLNYENEYLTHIKEKNKLKIMNIVATSIGVSKQMENVTEQILQNYNQMCA